MKASRNIMRRVEMKIYHAITAEQIKKSSSSETAQKQDPGKTAGEESPGSK